MVNLRGDSRSRNWMVFQIWNINRDEIKYVCTLLNKGPQCKREGYNGLFNNFVFTLLN